MPVQNSSISLPSIPLFQFSIMFPNTGQEIHNVICTMFSLSKPFQSFHSLQKKIPPPQLHIPNPLQSGCIPPNVTSRVSSPKQQPPKSAQHPLSTPWPWLSCPGAVFSTLTKSLTLQDLCLYFSFQVYFSSLRCHQIVKHLPILGVLKKYKPRHSEI